MKQVHIFEDARDVIPSADVTVFSSRWKAISYCNRAFDRPDFKREEDTTTVSVDGSTVGWITKKIVQ